jgi:hypothetical protein
LFEGDLARLFKVFFANLLLSSRELCDIGVVALLNILVCALKDGIFLKGLDSFFLLNAAESSLSIILASAEINSSLDFNTILAALPEFLTTVATNLRTNFVS